MVSARPEQEPSLHKFPGREPEPVSIAWIMAVLLLWRRTIVVTTAICIVAALAIAFLRPITYTTNFSFVPEVAPDQGSSGLAGLAGQLGVNLGSVGSPTQSPQFYADLMNTHQLLAPIANDSFQLSRPTAHVEKLSQFLGVAGSNPAIVTDKTVQILRDKVLAASVAARTTGVVDVRVRTTSPEVSLGIAQRVIDGLNQFNLSTRQSQAAAERRFVEDRLNAARASLRAAEDALQEFLQSNRVVGVDLSFQRDRLQREVALRQQLVLGLSQQYEEARIREVRDTPVITVIERPILPVLPDPRGRATTVILGMLAGLFFGIVTALAREGWKRQRQVEAHDPSYDLLAGEWQRFRARFRRS
jgi:uncharacterized protein involved in exopolysaccharide biosynthesis